MPYKQTNEGIRDEHAVIGGVSGKKVFVIDNAGNQIVQFSTATVTIQGLPTLAPSPNFIGLVSIAQPLTSLTTIYPRTDYIGLMTVTNANQPAIPAGTAFIGLATTIPSIYGATGLSSLASIGTTSSQIVPSNTSRFSLIVRNISNTTVFVSMTSPATTTGMYLRQDDTYETDHYRGALFGLVGAGGGEVRYIEENI